MAYSAAHTAHNKIPVTNKPATQVDAFVILPRICEATTTVSPGMIQCGRTSVTSPRLTSGWARINVSTPAQARLVANSATSVVPENSRRSGVPRKEVPIPLAGDSMSGIRPRLNKISATSTLRRSRLMVVIRSSIAP